MSRFDRSALIYGVLRSAFALTHRVPLQWSYRVGVAVCEVAYWGWLSKRHYTRRNMAVLLGTAVGDRRAAALARASWRNYGRYLVDFLNLANLSPEEVAHHTQITGWEHLDRALEAGRGAIFVSMHYGLWDYAPGVLAQRYPGRVHIVVEPFTSASMDRLVQGQRGLRGIGIIQMTAVRQMVRTLRENGIICLLVDRPVHGDGVPVEFFGHLALVPGGAATLAALTGAALLPGYFAPCSDGGFEGQMLAAAENPRSGERATDVRIMTQRVFTALEPIVARDPAHWYMFRDLWGPLPATAVGDLASEPKKTATEVLA